MKILLLFKPNPKIANTQQNITPNGILYIAALLLSKNIAIEVLNLTCKSWEECRDIIKNKNPDVVGISCYTFNRHACIKLAEIVKDVNKKIKVVFGGPHPSILHTQLLENSKDIDIITLNESEITFLEVINSLQDNISLENVRGIIYRNNEQIIKNGPMKPLENLDELPIPAQYFKYKRIITSRGCPGRCIFCDTPYLWGQKVRLRSAKNVVDELEMLNKRYGISSFIMSDDTFTFDKDRTIRICKEVIKRDLNITWDCRSRVNLICEERLSWMKKAGCVSISYGIESGSQKILNCLEKGITAEQIKKAAALTRKFGFNLNYFIIVGSPGETDDTVRETMRLIEETKPTEIQTYIMQLTPGTQIYKMAKEKNLIKESDWVTKEDETIFYTDEKSLKELNRYKKLIDGLFRFFNEKLQYSEEELKESIKHQKGVQDLINLAHLRLRVNKHKEAEEIIDEAIELNPGSSSAFSIKAALLAMKKDESCIDFFNKAIKADPENLLAYQNLGLFLFKEKRYDEAIDIFNKAIEVEPANVEFYSNLGSIYGVKEDYGKAIETFEKALLIDPYDKEALKNLEITFDKISIFHHSVKGS